MKISVSKKSSVILYFILLSTISFGLFFSYHFISNPDLRGEQNLSRLQGDTIPPRKSDPSDSVYRAILLTADRYLLQKAYDKSLAELKKAQLIKPNDPLLKEKMFKLNGLISTQKQLFETSQKSVLSGDAYFKNKDYLNAKSSYQLAVSQNAEDTIAREKLRKTLDLLRSQKAQNILFDVAIAGADKLFQAGDYVKAQQEYENASKLLPGDPYPKSKINEIIKIQVDRQVRDEDYAKTILLADKFFAGKNYQDALLNYKKAGTLNPDEKYPQEKIKELTQLIADIKARDEAYRKAIDLADLAFASTRYAEAMKSYQDALVIKPGEVYPSNKIKEIEGILARIAKAQSDYNQYIVLADSFYIDKQYLKARDNYQMAISAKPGESYPKQMMTKAEMMMTGQEAAMARLAEEQYAKAITTGDKLLLDKAYAQAKLQYQEALKIKGAEQYPKDKIAEIDKVMADLGLLKDRDAKYAAAIANGDKLLLQKSYAPARTEYTNASSIKPDESYPKEKMAAIDKILSDLAEAKALEDKYTGIIVAADKLLAAKTYDQARAEYQKAVEVKPEAAYPKEKMAAIDKILSDLAALKSLDENYKAGIAKADQYLSEKSYDLARSEYAKASGLKPAEQYPKTKITEIDGILAAIAKQKALDDEYAADILNGDKLLADKSYAPARLQYQAALKLKASEQYPKDKITEIDKALAELALMKDRDAKYAAAIANGDKLLLQKSYAPARTEYTNASSIKPDESYPKEKMAAIDKILSDLAEAKALEDKYTGIIVAADKLLAAKTYDQARAEYQKAVEVKPEAAYPKEKMAAIDKILSDLAALKSLDENYKAGIAKADQYLSEKSYDLARSEYAKASGLKPAEQYPKTKITEIDGILAAIAKQKALDDEYAADISNGDKLLADKSYDLAMVEYKKATALKTSEQYPKTKLAEIEKVMTETARLKAIDDQYNAAITAADKLLQDKAYDQAKSSYLDAGKIKPSEQYPKDKVTEINGLLAAIAKQKSLDDQYKLSLSKADALLESKTYDQAKLEYLNAGKLKPDEQYTRDKIAEIDAVMAEMKAKEDAYKASIANADQLLVQKKYEEARTEYQNAIVLKPQATYPKEKIAEINKALEELLGKQKYYENLVATADKLLKEKDYAKALESYQQALALFPAQTYPKEQIGLISARVDSLYRANKSFYDKAVADGDRFYNLFEFDKAVDAYNEAANFLPMEKYPREMIVKIRRTIAENAIADVMKTTVVIASNTEKQFPFPPVNIASRKNNFIYIKIKNLSNKPFNILMRYGKDKQANGGVVMRNLSSDGKVNERLVSVRDQDLWSREDNNWISLYPQGGDVEVSFIQVSRAK